MGRVKPTRLGKRAVLPLTAEVPASEGSVADNPQELNVDAIWQAIGFRGTERKFLNARANKLSYAEICRQFRWTEERLNQVRMKVYRKQLRASKQIRVQKKDLFSP